MPENLCSGFHHAGIVPFNPAALIKLVPDDSVSHKSIDSMSQGRNPVDKDCSLDNHSSDTTGESEEEMSDVDGNSRVKSLNLSPEREELYKKRLEEGYDLPDEEYL